MSKIITFLLTLTLIFSFNAPVFAEPPTPYEDQKALTPEEVSILKYKMERITVRQEHGKWVIIQGINSELTDIQLLKLVNSENIAMERTKNIEFKQNLGSGVALAGGVLGVSGGLFVGNIIKVDNGTYYGIGGIIGGLALLVVGNLISPIVSDEGDHTINVEEAKSAAQKYNTELRKKLNLESDID